MNLLMLHVEKKDHELTYIARALFLGTNPNGEQTKSAKGTDLKGPL